MVALNENNIKIIEALYNIDVEIIKFKPLFQIYLARCTNILKYIYLQNHKKYSDHENLMYLTEISESM